MPVLILLVTLAILALIFGPSAWVKHMLASHGRERPDFPGTGGELARHLLDEAGLSDVTVEAAPKGGDHYDSGARAVRLSPEHLNGRSLAAVAVAAHEVGHALQDRDGCRTLVWRHRLHGFAQVSYVAGYVIMIAAPLLFMGTRGMAAGLIVFVAGWTMRLAAVAAALATLPNEYDASFRRALPILEAGNYIAPRDRDDARRILKAAALTYVAGALTNLIFMGRGLPR